MALAAGAFICRPTIFPVVTVFGLAHATKQLGVPRETFLDAVLIAAALECLTLPAFGALADRKGRRIVYAFGLLITVAWAFPAFALIGTGRPALICLAVVVAISVGHAAQYAPAAAFFTELFPTRRRCAGASLGYQIGAAAGGGLSPLLATSLVAGAGGCVVACRRSPGRGGAHQHGLCCGYPRDTGHPVHREPGRRRCRQGTPASLSCPVVTSGLGIACRCSSNGPSD